MRRVVLLLSVVLTGALALAGVGLSGSAVKAGAFTYNGTVARIVDGDTLDVRLGSGKSERVRVIGIDTPERGACFFSEASGRTSSLALGKRVTLRGDPTQDTRDRYGRLLAYVDVNGSLDLGLRLVREGYAAVYVFRNPFRRLSAYQAAAGAAKTSKAGVWTSCAVAGTTTAPTPPPPPVLPVVPPTPPPSSACHPNYSKCLPIVSDLDCADIRAMGKAPVQVLGADPYRLDGDNDGLGCE